MYLELSLPVCSIIFSSLLYIMFTSKKKVKLVENNMYVLMLICVLLDSILVTVEKGLVIGSSLDKIPKATQYLVCLLNKFDACILIMTTSCILLYIAVVSLKLDKISFRKILYPVVIFNLIIYCFVFTLDFYLIENGNIISITGNALYPTYLACGLNIIAAIIITISNPKNISTKHIPLFATIILFIFLMFIFSINPYITIISIVLTFINYVMYFTIENPDVKMVDELIENRKIIERASEEKSVFLFKMSQGLKEPVHNIEKQIYLYNDGNLSAEGKQEVINNIEESNKKISYLINDVLGINSFDKRNIKKIERTYNIYSLLDDIKKRGKTYINKDIDYKFNVAENMPKELYGDAIKLKQAVMSVLINAINHTDKGYVQVDVSSFTKYDICRIVISIEDSGSGMNLANVNATLDQDIELTENDYLKLEKLDVDLTLSYKIIKMLGGTMYIKSEHKKGTEIIITLDQYIVENEEIRNNSKVDNYLRSRTNTRKSLIVNDNEKETQKIRKILEHKGYEVVVSMYGQDAIDRIRNKEKYDLILIDDEMPLMNGINVLQELVKLKNKSKKLVLLEKDKIFISEHYVKDGFDNFIDKTKLIEEIREKC